MPLRLSYVQGRSVQCSLYPQFPFRHFHTTSPYQSDSPDFYKTLDLQPNASQASIKKQFYALSHLHHPDHNPDNRSAASERFVAISAAYATLGSPTKRESYDREHHPSHSSVGGGRTRPGSHSSASTPFGSRPASGLSKRRTQFRGPPPSFYRSGGWGAHGAKRAAAAEGHTASASSAAGFGNGATSGGGSGGREGGMGYGQGSGVGWNDVRHFDREGHLWTHEQQDLRRKRRMEGGRMDGGRDSRGFVLNFALIGTVVGFACFMPVLWEKALTRRREAE